MVALVVSVAPLFGWKDAEFLDRVNIQQRCLISQDVSYQVFATCATFYVPLAVILIVYWKIFQTARTRIRKRHMHQQHTHNGLVPGATDSKRRWYHCRPSERSNGVNEESDQRIKDDEPRISTDDANAAQQHSSPPVTSHPSPQVQSDQQTTAFTIEIPDAPSAASVIVAPATQPANGSIASSPAKTAKSSQSLKENPVRKKRETLEAKRERKAAKTLAIITGAFVMCWLPFFVCALLMPLRPDWVFDETMLSVFLWLGYLNSTLNPIIYTIFSPEFRQAFKRLLCGKAAVNGASAYRPRKLR